MIWWGDTYLLVQPFVRLGRLSWMWPLFREGEGRARARMCLCKWHSRQICFARVYGKSVWFWFGLVRQNLANVDNFWGGAVQKSFVSFWFVEKSTTTKTGMIMKIGQKHMRKILCECVCVWEREKVWTILKQNTNYLDNKNFVVLRRASECARAWVQRWPTLTQMRTNTI